mgnify:FL=1|tara:strand:+ start:93 stop:317 length:225 start_codon:yes stop_codon:yes gene_type:complete
MDNVNQLADLIMAIIQDKVDERIEQRVADMSDSVAEFDIQDHRDDIVNMIEEDVDFSDKMNEALSDVSFTTTID